MSLFNRLGNLVTGQILIAQNRIATNENVLASADDETAAPEFETSFATADDALATNDYSHRRGTMSDALNDEPTNEAAR